MLRKYDKKAKSEYDKAYYVEHKEDITEYQKKYRNDNKVAITNSKRERAAKDPRKRLITSARDRAKEKGIAFDLTVSDVVVPKFCPVLGILIAPGVGRQTAHSPSLDRIKPELGYVAENVQVISYKANAMKQNASTQELVKFAEWVLKNYATTLLSKRSAQSHREQLRQGCATTTHLRCYWHRQDVHLLSHP